MDTFDFALIPKFGEDEKRVVKIDRAETPLGRGKHFEINDKRVSRNHAVLLLDSDGLTLKSTHINPCFVYLKAKNKKILLKQGEDISLQEEDEFSLLQDKYQFLVQVSLKENHKRVLVEETASTSDNQTSKMSSKLEKKENDTITCQIHGNKEVTENVSAKKISKLTKIFPQKKTTAKSDSTATSPTPAKKRKLPRWMIKNQSAFNDDAINLNKSNPSRSASANVCVTNESTNNCENTVAAAIANEKVGNNIHAELQENDVKRETLSGDFGKNNFVRSPRNIKPESPSVSRSTDVNSDDEAIEKNTSESNLTQNIDTEKVSKIAGENDTDTMSSLSNSSSPVKIREPCVFGKSCYRKNPVHLQEFSHPGDNDYVSHSSSNDEDHRPECEYGLQCYRKNPNHKRKFRHTRRVNPKRIATKPKQDDQDEDNSYDDSFIDDEEEEEEDIVSDDSDWNPDLKKKQKESKSDSDQDSDEDISALVSSAKKFTKNKNMWKK